MLGSTLRWLVVALFVASAAVQYNDPDPWIWIGVYSLAAFMTVALSRLSSLAMLAMGLGGLSLIAAGLLAASLHGPQPFIDALEGKGMAEALGVEEARETGGLILVGVWLVGFGAYTRRQRADTS